MAAPSNVYLDNGATKLPLHLPGVLKQDVLLALQLAEYYSLVRTYFYLDALLIVTNGAKTGFAGIIFAGSANSYFHSQSRWSNGRTSNGGIILNDGGLNTLGNIAFNSVSTRINYGLTISMRIKSAYYVATTGWGFRFRLAGTNNNWGFADSSQVVPERTEILASTYTNQFQPNDIVEYQMFNTNPEGTFYSALDYVTVGLALILMRGPALYGSQAVEPNYQLTNYYSEKADLTGRVYSNVSGTILAGAGYYQTDLNSWVLVDGNGYIIRGGGLGNWDAGDPQAYQRFTQIPFVGQAPPSGSHSWQWACANPSQLVPITCYFDNDQNKYVYSNNNNGYDLLPAGYYYVSPTQFMYIVNGEKISDGYCNDGEVIPIE